MNPFQSFIKYFTQFKYPKRLRVNGRKKLPTSSFQNYHKLYRSFELEHLDENDEIKLERVKFPDISCNWSEHSEPEDISFIENTKPTDGCYSFTVQTARFERIATPVHDPRDEIRFQNYAHVEVRVLKEGEDIDSEPPRKRRLNSPRKKIAYRQNIINCLNIEFEAK